MNEKLVRVKASPLGQDFQDALYEKLSFHTLDVAQSIIILKGYLVNDLSPDGLKYLYPTYFDAARVLIAECAAEFFQAGCIRITALDPLRMRYREHEARRLVLTPQDIAQLLRVLRRVREPAHGLYLRHKADTACWLGHIQAVQQALCSQKGYFHFTQESLPGPASIRNSGSCFHQKNMRRRGALH